MHLSAVLPSIHELVSNINETGSQAYHKYILFISKRLDCTLPGTTDFDKVFRVSLLLIYFLNFLIWFNI